MGYRKKRGKRGISKLAISLIAISFFVLLVFPFFGDFIRGTISMGLAPLQSVGSTILWIGIMVTFVGVITMFPSNPDKSTGSKRSTKFVLIGIILIVIGLFLENPLSLFSEGGSGLGYH